MVDDLGNPYDPGTPEYDQFVRGMYRGAGVAATALPAGALGAVLPDPRASGVQAIIPGGVSGLYGTADYLAGAAQRAVAGRPLLTPTPDEWHLPGGEAAAQLAQGSQDSANHILSPIMVQPQTPGEQVVQNAFEAAGSMLVPVPGAISARLPSVVRGAAKFAYPGSAAAAIPAAVITGGLSGALTPSDADAQPAPPANTDALPTPPIPPNEPPVSTALLSPEQAKAVVPHVSTALLGAAGPDASDDPTGLTWGKAIAGATAGVAVLAGVRYVRPFVRSMEAHFYPGAAIAPGVDALSEARGATLNQDAVVQDAFKGMAQNPSIGQRLVAQYGDINGSQAMIQRYQAGAEAGQFHGVNVPPLTDWYRGIANLTDQQRDLLNTAMHYGNELDNRNAAMRRVNFQDIDSATLQNTVIQARADPEINALIMTAKAQTDAYADILRHKGMIDVVTANKLKRVHNYYVPDTDMYGVVENPLRARTLTGGDSSMTPIWQLRDQHDFQLMKAIDQNDARLMFVKEAEAYLQRNPNADPVVLPNFSASTGQWEARSDGSSFAVRDGGVLKHYTAPDPSLFKAIAAPPVQMNAVMAGMNKVRQVAQSFITGAGAVATGHVFPIINSLRTAGEASVLRPKGFVGSHLEKYTGIPADPITPYLGTAYRMGADALSEGARGLAAVLEPGNPGGIAQRIQAMLGPQAAAGISQRLQSTYSNTVRGMMREHGLLGSAGMVSTAVEDTAMKGRPALMPNYDRVPELFRASRYLPVPTLIHLRNFFKEMTSVLGEAGHSNFYALNRDRVGNQITQHQLNFETRQITGDPGTRGSGLVSRSMGQVIPYHNIARQELARVARAFNEQPMGVMSRWMTHYGTLALGSVFTAMLAGPEAVRHLFDESTDVDRSKEARLYIPGYPQQPVRLPLQISIRVPYAVTLQAAYDLLNMHSHEANPDIASNVMSALTDFFGHHVWQSTQDAAVAGVSQATPPLTPAAITPAVQALAGKTVDPTLYNAYMHAKRPISEMFSYDINGSRHIPDQAAKIDPVTGSVNGDLYHHVFSDIFGLGATAAWDFYKDATHKGGGVGPALSNFVDAYARRLSESVPGGNMLWSVEDGLARSTALQNRVERSLEVMRPTIGWKADARYAGLTRKGGQPLIEPNDSAQKLPDDPTMVRMYQETGAYMQALESKPNSPLKLLNDLRTQVSSLRNSPLPPEELRAMRNDYERQIQQQLAQVQTVVHKLNTQLSTIAGRAVSVDKIDFRKGMEQFAQ